MSALEPVLPRSQRSPSRSSLSPLLCPITGGVITPGVTMERWIESHCEAVSFINPWLIASITRRIAITCNMVTLICRWAVDMQARVPFA